MENNIKNNVQTTKNTKNTKKTSYELYKKELNVFKFGYLRWSYLPNIPKNIAQFFRNLKYAWERCMYGFSESDVWNFSYYLSVVIANGLMKLDADRYGYPSGMTDEKWSETLKEMANHFYNSIEDNPNVALYQAYDEAYDKMQSYVESADFVDTNDGYYTLNEVYTDEEAYNKAKEEWMGLTQAYQNYMKKEQEKGLAMLSENFDNLWD